jgi:hypothetical protein
MWYKPSVDVTFTWAEVSRMISLSESHYDGVCRQLSVDGKLNGMRNRFYCSYSGGMATWSLNATIEERLTATEADLLSKVCERDPVMLYKLQQVFNVLNDKWNEMNPQPW